MIVEILETTDGKFVGMKFDTSKPIISPDGVTFHPEKITSLGKGVYRFSNSNYVVLAKEVII